MTWLDRNFSVRTNPGGAAWLLYYLHALERAARLTGRNRIGDHDWFRETAEFLVQRQDAERGSWQGEAIEANPILATCFALLVLTSHGDSDQAL